MAASRAFDVVVVGGGPAGLTAAVHAAKRGARVALVDQMVAPGQKIAIAGGGRCNILPTAVDPARYVTDSSRHTLRKILLSWRLDDVRSYLEEEIGLPLRQESGTGKVFPASGGGEGVRRRLLLAVKDAHVELRLGGPVTRIATGSPHRLHVDGAESILASRVVWATGGLSYRQTGSDGTGLEIAKKLGHRVVQPYPALVPLRGGPEPHRKLAGLSLPVSIAVVGGEERTRSSGPFLFTHRGYSGPAVLDIAHLAVRAARDGRPLRIAVTWGTLTPDEWAERLAQGGRLLRTVIAEILPDRLAALLVSELGLDDVRCDTCSKANRRRVIEALTAYPLPWSGTGGWEEAEVTGGGVALSEVDPRTLESRIVPGLHFCGEILDAFGPIGGHNFLWAFVTGKLAGEGAGGVGSSDPEAIS